MNRKRRGFTSRQGTPSRSRLNTDNWYDLLLQQINTPSSDEIINSVNNRQKQYQQNNNNFENFMDYATAADDESAAVKAFQDNSKNELPEIIVTPNGTTDEESLKKEREASREMLKEKRWINGLSGGDSFTRKDEDELRQLDLWHDIIYSDNEYANRFGKYEWTPNTPEEAAQSQAKERLMNIVKDGAPEGYWLRTLKQIPSKILEADFSPLNLDLGYRNILGIPDPFYYMKRPGIALYDSLVYGDDEKQKSNLFDDISTTFLKRVNETQIDNSKGKIQRTQEMQMLGSLGMEDLMSAMQNTDQLKRIRAELLEKREQGILTPEENTRLLTIGKEIDNALLQEGTAARKLDTLASYEAENPLTQAWSKLNYALDKVDFAYDLGIRDDLSGLKDALRTLYHYRVSGDREKSAEKLQSIQNILQKFNTTAEKVKEGWNKDIEGDEEDLKKITDRYTPSSYFEAQDQLSQDLGLFNPKKILFSTPGLLGASMSSTPKSLLKIGSFLLGFGKHYSAGRMLTAGGINLVSGGAQATDENNAEVGGTYSTGDFIQQLSTQGVLDNVLKEGRKLLNDKNANIGDVIDAFTRGEIMFNDRDNRNAMLNIIAGANQQWAYDMNATAPGVWIDAAITTIPDAAYAKAIRFGKKLTPSALRKAFKDKMSMLDDIATEAAIGGEFAGRQAIPLEEIARIQNAASARGIRNAVYIPYTLDRNLESGVAGKVANETIDQLQKKFVVLGRMAKYMPNKWFGIHNREIRNALGSLALRSVTGMGSEFWEEDVQSIRQHQRKNGEYDSEYISGAYNPSIIFDNVLRGVRSSWDFVFKDPLHATQEEREIWKEAKLGALGWLAQGGIPVFAQSANGMWNQYNMTEVAAANIRATKAEDDALIQKGIQFAKNAKSVQDYDRMMTAFDNIERTNKNKNQNADQDESQVAYPQQFIEQNRKLYQTIFNMYHSDAIQNAAKNAGMDLNSEDYDEFVSIMARQADIYRESGKNHSDTESRIENAKILAKSETAFTDWLDKNGLLYFQDKKQKKHNKGQHKISDERREELRKQFEEEVDKKFQLAELAAVVDMYQTYKSMADNTNRKSYIADNLKKALDDLNETRKKDGYSEIKSLDDINPFVTDKEFHDEFKEEFAALYGFMVDFNVSEDIWLNALLGKDVVENGKKKKMYTGKQLVERYRKTSKSDKDLQNTLENDFYETVRRNNRIQEFVNDYNITDDNNVYTGFDGKTYVAKRVPSRDGRQVTVKYQIDKDTNAITGDPMWFDPEEFYTYHEMIKRDQEIELSEDSTDEERAQAGKRRLRRKLAQDQYKNRLNVEELERLEDRDQEQNPNSYYNFEPNVNQEQKREEQQPVETSPVEAEVTNQEEAGYTIEDLENEPAEVKSTNRVQDMFANGWTFFTKRTKKGKLKYFARNGKQQVRLTEKEGQEAMSLQESLPQSQQDQKPFLSGRIEDYEYDEGSYKGIPGSHNATEEAVIAILNAAYSGNEAKFNELLEWARFSLTNDQIDELKLVFAEVNGYFAKEDPWVEQVYNEREQKKQREQDFNKFFDIINNFVNKYSIALFKFGRLIARFSPEIIESWIKEYEQENPNAKELLNDAKNNFAGNGINRAQQTIALVRAKFHFYEKGNNYFAEAETGEKYQIKKIQYEFADFVKRKLSPTQLSLEFEEPQDVQNAAPVSNPEPEPVQPQLKQYTTPTSEIIADESIVNQQIQPVTNQLGTIASLIDYFRTHINSNSNRQDEVLNILKQYNKELNPDVLHQFTTAFHYFIRENGKVVLYDRVHEYLRDKLHPLDDINSERHESATEIYNALMNSQTHEEFVSLIREYQLRWNNMLGKILPVGSLSHSDRMINLSGYELEDIYNYSKEEAARAIAEIAAIQKIKIGDKVEYKVKVSQRYVDAGNIVDEIVRNIFSGKKNVVNRVGYRMSDSTFNQFVKQVQERKKQLDRLEIKVLTDEIITFAEINGRRVAGVMDMVAVDRFGNAYIIDFKTTYAYAKYNNQSDKPVSKVMMSEIDNAIKNLSENETIEFNRQSLSQYRKQLSVYRQLLKTQHPGIDVKNIFIAPVLVSHKAGLNPITNQYDDNVFGGFNEGGIRPYKVFNVTPDNSLFDQAEPEPDPDDNVQQQQLDQLIDDLTNRMEKINSGIEKMGWKNNIPVALFAQYIKMKSAIEAANVAIDAFEEQNTIPDQTVFDHVNEAKLAIDEFSAAANRYVQQQLQTQQAVQPTTPEGGIPNTPEGHNLNADQRDPYGEYFRYNNLELRKKPQGWSDQKWKDFKRVSALPDFLEHSTWELNVKSYIRVMGSVMNSERSISKPSLNVTIRYVEHLADGTTKTHIFGGVLLHVQLQFANGTKLTHVRKQSPLLQKIDSILYDVLEDGNLKLKPGAEDKVITLTGKSRTNGKIEYDSNNRRPMLSALQINDAEVEGLMQGNSIGQLGLISHGNVRPITESRNSDKTPIYTYEEGREQVDGMVALKRNLPYTEDKDSDTHTPIIPLTPKHLSDNDIDLIVDILTHYREYVMQHQYRIKIGNEWYDSPVKARDILHSIIRFGDSARITGSRFIFDFVDENGQPNYSKIQITNWGEDTYTTYDISTADGIKGLKDHLKSGGYVYYNNENLMRKGTSRSIDSTPGGIFENIEEFFKNNPKVNRIQYSDSMVFDRADVDPKQDGSYEGIRGFHWMIRHGWIMSDYQTIELPLMSVTDAEEGSNQNTQQQPVKTEDDSTDKEVIVRKMRDGDDKPSITDDPMVGPINLNQDNSLDNIDLDNIDSYLNKTVVSSNEKSLDKEQALNRIHHILGSKFPTRFVENVIETLSNGHIVVGRLSNAGITLSEYAQNGVEFHEAFHAVMEILLPEFARKRIYSHYNEKYLNGRNTNERVIAEGLADLYYEFKLNSPEIKLTWNIIKLFKNISAYVNALRSINDTKMALLFAATDTGIMRLFNTSDKKFERLNRFGKGLNYEIILKDGKSVTVDNFHNQKEVDDLVETLVYKFIHDSGVETLGTNLDKIDTRYSNIASLLMATPDEKKSMIKQLKDLEKTYGENAIDHLPHSKAFKTLIAEKASDKQLEKLLHKKVINPLQYRNTMMFREAFDKWSVFRELVENKIQEKGVDRKLQREEQAREDQDGGEGFKQEDFGHFNQPFYEHSMRDDVPTRIKFFLSTRPNRRWATPEDVRDGLVASTHMEVRDDKGNIKKVRIPVDIRNNSLGYSTYQSYQYVYNLLLRTAHHARSIKEFDDILHKLGENDFTLYNIAKNYHKFRRLSYIRYQSENEGKYRNIPKVMVKGKLLDPSEYISDFEHLTEEEEFPTVVRYTHDVYDKKDSKLLHRQGDIIQDAVIMTDADYEQLVVQLFQAVHAQKLNYQFMFASMITDAEGTPTGKYSYRTDYTNTDQSMQAYPHLWFDTMRSGWGGIIQVGENGEPTAVLYDGKPSTVFADAAKFFRDLRSHTATGGRVNRHNVSIDGVIYDMDDPEGFDVITSKIVQVLNSIGVDITKQAFNYMLLQKYSNIDSMPKALSLMLNSNGVDSIDPLVKVSGGVLVTLQEALDNNNMSMFTTDKADSGSALYAGNGFFRDLASWIGKYKLSSQESMVLGPENTKMCTYAQHNSASDTVDELNNVFDKDGNLKREGLVQDLMKSPYVLSKDGKEGSVIIRAALDKAFNANHDRFLLCTSSGVKLNIAGNGGTKYSEITVVEDWLSKASILQDGHIIFPTLSDKSTWFFLKGLRLKGYNYDDIESIVLPLFTHTGNSSRFVFGREDYKNGEKQQYFNTPIDVIDQLIEYAYRELDFINQTINQLGIQDVNQTDEKHLTENEKIKNFHTGEMHGARFAFLTGVYGRYIEKEDDFEFDENYDEFYDFNIYDEDKPEESVLTSRERAMRVFFDKRVGETDQQLKARQRSMIANILQHRVKDQLKDLVEKGIIEELDENVAKFKKYGNQSQLDPRISPFLGFKNVLLDDSKIKLLKSLYAKQMFGNQTYEQTFTDAQLESAAITAYVYDITAKSIMSKEETQRVFTGFPHFFKWKFEDGHLIDIMEDESKRLGGEGSTGTSNVLDLPNLPKTYRAAEIKDWEIQSPFAKSLAVAFRDNEYRDALVNKRVEQWYDEHRSEVKFDEENEGLFVAERKAKEEFKEMSDKELDAIFDEVYSMPLEEVEKQLGEDAVKLLNEKITAESNSFVKDSKQGLDGINVADGTAFITDKMAENLLRMRGAWNKDVEQAFKYLRGNGNKYLNNAKQYRVIVDALIGTQKYSAFGYRMQNGVPVHYYNKYALFPIFKGIAYGFTAKLYEKMNDPKNGVDAVLMTSAVKVGSQASQKFNPDMTEEDLENFSFKDHTYIQHYSQIRRQLNTDPHEREEMPVGTQSVKVALSTIRDNQLYTRPDGSQVRGRELKNSIMDNIKKLSKLGKDRLKSKFFDGDKLDIKKFAKFAESELSSRGADKNLLNAIRDLYNNPSPILNAVSNMAWIESIMVSIINKNIIDINLPGNAFYQRTVFGLDGIMSDSDFPTLAGGRPLQMINEEGSMDAVVSIDFFYNIIPKEFRYNFDKAKQWLIDNGIISGVKSWSNEWSNAKANCMSYRIPTQGISSIHALRFVDVVPILRDTIILPKEFTKITGSDFDIDKLFLNMYNYKIYKSADDYLPKIKNVYDAKHDISEEEDPVAYYQNQILDDYLTLLKDAGKIVKKQSEDAGESEELLLGRYIHYLHRSIDNDTSLVKGVLKNVEKDNKKSPVEPFVTGSLYTQSNLKNSFMVGKFLIGPWALNLNSHIMTTLYHVGFKSNSCGIMTLLDGERLDRYNDRDGNSIQAWLSAFINACVDVAKDPYILRLNINKYTINTATLLVRTGFGKDALYFTVQPIIKKLAQKVLNESGDIVTDPSLTPYERQRQKEKEIAESIDYGDEIVKRKIIKLYGFGNNKYSEQDFKEDAAIFEALFGIKDGKYTSGTHTILEDLATNRDILINKDGDFTIENMSFAGYYDINGTKYSARALQGYIFIAKKMFDEYSEALNNLVQHTKIDTKKHGINFLDQQDYLEKYEEMKDYNKNMFNRNLQRMLEDSFIDQKTHDAIDMLPNILGSQMIHFTPQFRDTVKRIAQVVNNSGKDTKGEIQKQLLTYMKQKVVNRIMDDYGIDWQDIIHGPNNLASRIQSLKRRIITDETGKYSHFASNGIITNAILDNINPVPYNPAFGQERYSLLQLNNSLDDDPDIENDYIDSWQQMWESDDEEIRKIALDLAIYAFMTSGDNRGFTKFFKYVPLKLRKDINYVDYMNEMYYNFSTNKMELTDVGDSFTQININEFLRNNWRSNKIIPVFSPYKNKKLIIYGNKTMYQDENKANGMPIYRNTWQLFAPKPKRNGTSQISQNKKTGLYPPFLKMHRPYSSSRDADPYLLYRLVSIGVDKDGNEKPVYALANQKGVSVRAGSQLFEIFEYGRDDQNQHVMTGHYLDDINWEETAQKLADYFVGKAKNDPSFKMNDQLFLGFARNPKTKEDIKSYSIITNKETGEQTITETTPTEYAQLLQEMWRSERNIRREEKTPVSAERPIKSRLRWSDQFKKFCKG